jgi:predicted dehydrogenase
MSNSSKINNNPQRMSRKKIKWGIIGLGKIAAKFASDLLLSDRSELFAVASRDGEKAASFACQFKANKHYGTYADLAADPDIDVVYIATPHVFHFEQSMMCLQQGKNVLCEKPLGMNSWQVQIMMEEARKRNLFLMEGLWTRFIPATEKLIDLLAANAIGAPIFLHADFGFKGHFDPESRVFNKQLGAGSLLDIGIYPVYLSLLVFGQPTEIKAMARMSPTGVDSYCAMLGSFAHGGKAMLESTIEADTSTEAILVGTEGSIKLHSRFHHSEKITLTKNGAETDFVLPYTANGYVHEIEEVENCLLSGKTESDRVPLQTSLNLTSVLDRIRTEIGLVYEADIAAKKTAK